MKKKAKAGEEGGAKWQDTYGDMVTLLLCFFVLLYSISNVDQQKYENLVRSLNPDVELEDQAIGAGIANDTETSEQMPEDSMNFEEVYQALQEMAQEMNIESQVTLHQGDGYTFISFRDKVFFEGDSPYLTKEGEEVLTAFSNAIAPAADSIQTLQVIGHTSQATPNTPNDILTDRTLSAERSARVVAFIQKTNILEPSKLSSSAYGQWQPIATFDTPEGRAKNRRAEILITKNGAVVKSLEEYYEEIYGGYPVTEDSSAEGNDESLS